MSRCNFSIKSIVSTREGVKGLLKSPGDAVLIQRSEPRWLMLLCPCGCGDEIPINLDIRSGKAWRIYNKNNELTLFPSVWRDTGCAAHFIIRRNQILLFDENLFSNSSQSQVFNLTELASRTYKIWPKNVYMSYVDIADKLGEIPWDVQESCIYLVKQGQMSAGVGVNRGMFIKK